MCKYEGCQNNPELCQRRKQDGLEKELKLVVFEMNICVCSIDRREHKGVTEPYISTLSEEEQHFIAFIKLKENPEGHRCLINELVSYRLAKMLGVLMPDSGVAVISKETRDNTYEIDLDKNYGSCFYSSLIEPAFTLNEKVIRYVDNKDIYEKIIVFDHLIYNSDRNWGNLILRGKMGKKILYVIDHSHVFKNQALWNSYSLLFGIKNRDYNDENILDNNDIYDLFAKDKRITKASLLSVANDFQEKCTEESIDLVLKDLPKDWLISSDDLDALKEYLLYRAKHLNQMCEMIVRKKGWENV